MGSRGGVGIEIELDRVPQRATGMTPYEIMLSESQERMLLVAEKGREEEVYRVFRKWGLEAAEIGVVTNDGKLRVHVITARLSPEIPNNVNSPMKRRSTTAPTLVPPQRPQSPQNPHYVALQDALPTIIASADVCSKRWIWQRSTDYQVRTNTIAGPGAEAAIVRIKETGASVAISLDGNGRYSYLNPREGAKLAVAECCRNLATSSSRSRVPPPAISNPAANPSTGRRLWRSLSEPSKASSEDCLFFEDPTSRGQCQLL